MPQSIYLIELINKPNSLTREIYADCFNIDGAMIIFYNIIDKSNNIREFVCAYPCVETIIKEVKKNTK